MTVQMLLSTSMRPVISDLVIPRKMTLRILARKMSTTQISNLMLSPVMLFALALLC